MNRYYICEGKLEQLTAKGMRKIMFYLFNDIIIIALPTFDWKKKKKFAYSSTIQLEGSWLYSFPNCVIENVALLVTEDETFVFVFDDEYLIEDWRVKINDALNYLSPRAFFY